MMPRRMDAVSMLLPVPPKVSRIKGTMTTSPKTAYNGRTASRLFAFQDADSLWDSTTHTAVKIPTGTPTTTAPAVT